MILDRIEQMTKRKFLPIVEPEKGKVLVDVFNEIKPKHVLGIRALIGSSAILMGKT